LFVLEIPVARALDDSEFLLTDLMLMSRKRTLQESMRIESGMLIE
jgi:hypothetical protein